MATELPADELADLLTKLPPNTKRLLYRELPYWKIEEVKTLLEYPLPFQEGCDESNSNIP